MNLFKELKFSKIINFKKFWKSWLLSVSLILIWTLLEGAALYSIRLVVDSRFALIDPVSKLAIFIISIFFVIELSMKMTNILTFKLLPTHIVSVQKNLLQELLNVSAYFYIDNKPSEISSKLINFYNIAENFLKLILYGILSVSFGFITTIIIISFTSKLLSTYFVIWMLSMLFLSFITLRRVTELSQSHAMIFNKLTWKLNDVLRNYLMVKSSCKEKYEFEKYSIDINKQVIAKRKLEWRLFLADLFRSIVSLIFFGLLIYYSLALLDEQVIMPGELFFVLSSAILCRRDVWRVCIHLVELYQDIGFITEFNKVRKQALDNACNKIVSIGSESINKLELNNVSVNFNDKKIIKNITLELRNRELIGVIGPSGSGKTTIAKLITGFVNPDKGCIKINSKLSKKVNFSRDLLYIQQEPILFNRSVTENIIYGKQFDKESFDEAIRKSICSEFLESPDVNQLSIGQKQKILIARALYYGTKWLILDEPTSFIDPMTAKRIVSNIIMSNSQIETFILITHNPALLKLMRRVIVVESGKITCDSKIGGLNKNKYYQNFVKA